MNLSFRTMAILLMSAWVGCSSRPKVEEIPLTADPAEEINKLESEIKAAAVESVNVLSPENFAKANDYLDEAKEERSEGDDAKDILEEVALGRAYLNKARETAETGKTVLKGVLPLRNEAVSARANEYAAAEWKKAEEELMEVTEEIEDGDIEEAEDESSELQKLFRVSWVKALQESHLREAMNTIEQAKNEGAASRAPRTLEQANAQLKEVQDYINNNPSNTDSIQERAKVVTQNAENLLSITRTVGEVGSKDDEQLAMEIMERKKRLETLKEETAAQAKASDEDLDAYYDLVRSQFSEEEAEVYRQGDKILIRLKGLNFPSGKSMLLPQNYGLLGKVQSVLQGREGNKVIVEGHTDSVGKKPKNQKISEERARAVKEYLTANAAVSEDQVETKGFGSERPIASNTDKKGRAANRRVDIVIEPLGAGKGETVGD